MLRFSFAGFETDSVNVNWFKSPNIIVRFKAVVLLRLSVAGFEIDTVNVNWFKSPSITVHFKFQVLLRLFFCGSLLLVLVSVSVLFSPYVCADHIEFRYGCRGITF